MATSDAPIDFHGLTLSALKYYDTYPYLICSPGGLLVSMTRFVI